MKEYSQVQKFISVIMIFVLLAFLSSCISTRIISTTDLPHTNSGKYEFIIHCEKIKFLLEKSTISNGVLSGKISKTYLDNSYDTANKIHLYLLSDSIVKIDPQGESLSVPLVQVKKAELHEIYGGTPFIFLGVVLVAFIVIGLAELASSPMFRGR